MIPILLLAAAVGCNTRAPQPQRDGDAEPGAVQRARSPGVVAEAAEAAKTAIVPRPADTALRWQIAATRGEGALRLRYADGAGQVVVFRDDLSTDCEVSPYQHPGAVMAMRCGRGAAARAFIVRRVDDELSVYEEGEQGEDGGSSPLAQVTLRAGLSRVSAAQVDDERRPADDEVLLSWVISHYQDVSLTAERPGQEARTQWLAELIGCDPEAALPPELRADDIDLALLCRHQGRTETLAARAGQREVVVVHELSSDELERHRVAVHRVALGDDDALAKPADADR